MDKPSAMERFDYWVRSIQVMESIDIPATPQDLRAGIRLAVEAAKEIGALEDVGWECCDGFGGGAIPSCGCDRMRLYRINPEALEQDDD